MQKIEAARRAKSWVVRLAADKPSVCTAPHSIRVSSACICSCRVVVCLSREQKYVEPVKPREQVGGMGAFRPPSHFHPHGMQLAQSVRRRGDAATLHDLLPVAGCRSPVAGCRLPVALLHATCYT
jgi:hypothetical protein